MTRLPLVLKGVLTAEDAVLAVQHGADAVWVSNHGARQVDCVPPTVGAGQELRDRKLVGRISNSFVKEATLVRPIFSNYLHKFNIRDRL